MRYFEKIALRRLMKEIIKHPSKTGLGLLLIGEKKGFSKHRLFNEFLRPAYNEKTVAELKKYYKNLPGVGISAPFRRAPYPNQQGFNRLIGHKSGNISLYHGTEHIDDVLKSGLHPKFFDNPTPDQKILFLTPDKSRAAFHGEVVKVTIPIKDIKYIRHSDEYITTKSYKNIEKV